MQNCAENYALTASKRTFYVLFCYKSAVDHWSSLGHCVYHLLLSQRILSRVKLCHMTCTGVSVWRDREDHGEEKS